MSGFLLHTISSVFNKIEHIINRTVPLLWQCYSFPINHAPALDVIGSDAGRPFPIPVRELPRNDSSLNEDVRGFGILWAVPRNRRSIEKRLTRRLAPEKRFHPKNNLKICDRCGHFHEFHTICGFCYEKVRQETSELQKVIEETLKLNPVEKEVAVIYKNDRPRKEDLSGKYPVEMPKERPAWFAPNLLSTVNPSRKVSVTQTVPPQPKVIVKD